MAPLRTSCAGPSGVSPQKPAPQPILTILPISAPRKRRLTTLIEGGKALTRILGARHIGEHELGVFQRAVETHLSDARQCLFAKPDARRRFADDASDEGG